MEKDKLIQYLSNLDKKREQEPLSATEMYQYRFLWIKLLAILEEEELSRLPITRK